MQGNRSLTAEGFHSQASTLSPQPDKDYSMTSTLEQTHLESPAASSEAAPVLAGVLAEYVTPQAVTDAARKIRAAGYTRVDAYTPFPFHELDAALGIRATILPWLTLGAAAIGASGALLMQWWMNAVSYKFLISGKPVFSIPSDMPVIFACAVLLASFATLFGMLFLNGLPRFANPLSGVDRFRRSTNDRFFLSIDARDPRFDHQAVMELLQSTDTSGIEDYWWPTDNRIPKFVFHGLVVLLALLCVPPVLIARMRNTDSRLPRFHLITDMDFQPKFKAQSTDALFSDGRAMRPQVAGTVARGQLEADTRLYKGLEDTGETVQTALISFQPPAEGEPPVDPLDKLPWVTTFPLPVDAKLMQRGQERFNIYCSTCHGLAGDGDGLITLRAMELEQGTWVKPVSFHTDVVRNQPVGRLFHTITNGVRKMPPMGDIVPAEDRWAILLYVRALQRSRHSTPDDVPAEVLPELKDF